VLNPNSEAGFGRGSGTGILPVELRLRPQGRYFTSSENILLSSLFPHFQSARRALAFKKIIRQPHLQPVKRPAQQVTEIRLVQRQQHIRPGQRGEQDRTILARGKMTGRSSDTTSSTNANCDRRRSHSVVAVGGSLGRLRSTSFNQRVGAAGQPPFLGGGLEKQGARCAGGGTGGGEQHARVQKQPHCPS
jgi:hypothetical protein